MGARGSGRKPVKEIKQFFIDYALLKGRLLKLESDHRRISRELNWNGDAVEEYVKNSKLLNIEQEIEDLTLTIDEIDGIIDSIDVKRADKAYSKILRKYYIDDEQIIEIAMDLNCSEDNIYRLKTIAQYNMMVILNGRKQCKSKYINPKGDKNE